ncbi:MAG: DinB family protein [Bryobacteraceae bacterium]
MAVSFLEESRAVLARTPATLDALLRGLPECWTEATEGPGTWSPYVVIGHLIHAERTDWMPRLEIILKYGTGRPFDTFDREGKPHAERQPLPALLDEFASLRRQNLLSLQLTEEQLDLQGTHPELGTVTVRQLLATWTAHDLAHILQISRVMAKRYKQEVGPWAEFLSVMK